ncbi:alpha/beta hydrolase [Myceligenerans pegani]|uniref:Alpha/beta hydrolase n=1 Tax=Myceligenerans pegani TaxID=2776917 RepID=A0ABR9MW10_9MICO|nr:alpha/beta hydrolase [Myceligenerans sp. TRM 65318]MBE1875568.1 alpha/beta hydrolase [Myceligenerans sp. TRM 65318]MBE3017839.1 alpha/beta hydrolase [Myceligenerans sp. TRM 65318]
MAEARRVVRAAAVTVGVLVGVAGVVVGGAWLGQDALVYHPDRSSPGQAARALDGGVDVTLDTADGLELAAWFVPPAPEARDRDVAVLVAPGNGSNRLGRAGLAALLAERGFAVLLLEYRGYGGNPGRPTEAGLALDARAAQIALAERGHPLERTIYFGESLGAGVVTRLQSEVPAAGLLLRSPFTSLADAGARHYPYLPVRALLRDRYEVLDRVAATRVPVTVVHGERDDIVPPEQSQAVADAAPRLVEHVVLPGVGHNDAEMFGPAVADAVVRLADHAVGR